MNEPKVTYLPEEIHFCQMMFKNEEEAKEYVGSHEEFETVWAEWKIERVKKGRERVCLSWFVRGY